ncbi:MULTISPECIES: UrcA family protein [unclassified Phenylobacterium]|uniref:UrcA family protein n=1 Tax=unclassified Phenylobacterium TaxID=2640670 RepID=UPI00083ADD61|nr:MULTISPECIES: UrcA family protein [unclassified Phenylobacterium]
MNIATLSACALLATAGPATAHASPWQEPVPPRVVISYADLNLRSAADANLLLGRIRNAAVQVCRASRQMSGVYFQDDCYGDAVRRAVKDVNTPEVTAAYHARFALFRIARLKLARLW